MVYNIFAIDKNLLKFCCHLEIYKPFLSRWWCVFRKICERVDRNPIARESRAEVCVGCSARELIGAARAHTRAAPSEKVRARAID